MSLFVPITVFQLLLLLILQPSWHAWGPGPRYEVQCPERCDAGSCPGTQRCVRTVLDDCGCCRVCAAGRGEHCYRTVSAAHRAKCGPGLRCDFYKDEDDYGDEYGVCRDCPYGTYGIECRKSCNCKAGGICDRETGECLKFKFFAKMTMKQTGKLKGQTHTGGDMGSGDFVSDRPAAPKWSIPR